MMLGTLEKLLRLGVVLVSIDDVKDAIIIEIVSNIHS
jgi:hypothetical protein